MSDRLQKKTAKLMLDKINKELDALYMQQEALKQASSISGKNKMKCGGKVKKQKAQYGLTVGEPQKIAPATVYGSDSLYNAGQPITNFLQPDSAGLGNPPWNIPYSQFQGAMKDTASMPPNLYGYQQPFDNEWYNRWRQWMDSRKQGALGNNAFDTEWYKRWREWMGNGQANSPYGISGFGSTQQPGTMGPPTADQVSPVYTPVTETAGAPTKKSTGVNSTKPGVTGGAGVTKPAAATRTNMSYAPSSLLDNAGLSLELQNSMGLPSSPGGLASSNTPDISGREPGAFGRSLGSLAGGNLMEYLPLASTAYNLAQGFMKPDLVNPNAFNNRLGEEALGDLRDRTFDIDPMLEANRAAQNAFNRNVTNVSQSGGQALSNMLGGVGARQRADMQAWSTKNNMENQYADQYARLAATIGAGNARGRMTAEQMNQAAQAARRNYLGEGFAGIGDWANNQMLMRNMSGRDNLYAQAMQSGAGQFGERFMPWLDDMYQRMYGPVGR